MNCLSCGELLHVVRENVPYRALAGVTLVGVEVSRCATCGEAEIAIPRIEALNRSLGAALIAKASRLTGDEVRFLRKSLGWSARTFAARMGTSPETVSRWENGKQSMAQSSERLLRVLVAIEVPIEEYTSESLEHIVDEPARSERQVARNAGELWTVERAA